MADRSDNYYDHYCPTDLSSQPAPGIGARTPSSLDSSPASVWWDEYSGYLFRPTVLNFIPPFDGSHLVKKMAPYPGTELLVETDRTTGPNPYFIQVAKPYIFEHTIQECIRLTGVTQAKEDQVRLSGVQWIDSVRKALRLPVRTFDTAVVYYHKFRLVHADTEYSFVDAAAAALFTACKIEDTLKKSRDILCAAHNLRFPVNEHLSPDDSLFEINSRTIIGLERLMLEASSFDFRNRHPQQLVIKLAKYYGIQKHSALASTAYKISLDVYRTFAPLKQTTAVLAFACLELAGRLLNQHNDVIESDKDYETWRISRAMVMETLLDLLELYTHYRHNTTIGPDFPIDLFLEVRIPLNQEMSAKHLPRFTEWKDHHQHHEPTNNNNDRPPTTNGTGTTSNGTTTTSKPKSSPKDASPTTTTSSQQPTTTSLGGSGSGNALLPLPLGGSTTNQNRAARIGERGRDGTVRFMLNPEREQQEKAVVAEYFRPEEWEWVEVDADDGEGGGEMDMDRDVGREKDRERDRDGGRRR